MGILFGTDGIRGVANRELTPELAFKIARITAWLLGRNNENPVFLIGKDTRLSGSMLESALTAGITSVGGEVHLLGITSTPSVAFLTRRLSAAAGIVVSASHNPIEDNGLKIFDSSGYKLSDDVENEIEEIYYREFDQLSRPEGALVGQAINDSDAVQQYLHYLHDLSAPLAGLKVVADCAHGAVCRIAGELLVKLGAEVVMLHDSPDGTKINVKCGATDTEDLQKAVAESEAALGLAFDGDADRLIAIDEKGSIVDGDAVMAICALNMLQKGTLKNNTLVTTVMSNGGLDILAEDNQITIIRTAVGDRYVLEKMLEGGFNLGGEQSGHIIFSDHATTGDGLLTAIELLKIVQEKQRPLSELASVLERLPQILVNQKVGNKEGWSENTRIKEAIRKVEAALGRHGRILVRPSGTEPKIRVMIEAPLAQDKLEEYAYSLADVIAREQG